MRRMVLTCVAVLLSVGSPIDTAGAQGSASPITQSVSPQQAVLNEYCVSCHNQELATAGILLDQGDVDHPADNPELWEKALHKLRTREMPPTPMPRPDDPTYDSLIAYVETALDQAAEARPNPGRQAVHRLNRFQYGNAIRDLITLEVDSALLFPADDSGYGFDNIGDVLTVSPVLVENYVSAAARISRLAVGDTSMSPTSTEYEVPHNRVQIDRETDDLPLGSRGGIAVRHYFPLDAEYVIKVRLQRYKSGQILGISKQRQLDVRLDGARVKLFTIGGQGEDGDENGDSESDGALDDLLEVRLSVTAGPHLIAATFVKDTVKPEGVLVADRPPAFFEGVGNLSIAGPYAATSPGNTPSRRKIFVCYPSGLER